MQRVKSHIYASMGVKQTIQVRFVQYPTIIGAVNQLNDVFITN